MWRLWLVVVLVLGGGRCDDVRSMRRARNVSGLVGLLSHQDPGVRIKAVDALAYVGDTRAVEPLIQLLGRDSDPYVREHVARNLGCDYHSSLGCESTETVQPLIEVLGDEDAFVRLEAVRSLGERALPEARSALEDVVQNDRRWEVREAAAFALGNIGSAESLVILHELLEDDQPRVAAAAQEALRRVGAVARIGAGGAGSAGKVKVLVDPGRGAVAPSAVGDGSASADGGP